MSTIHRRDLIKKCGVRHYGAGIGKMKQFGGGRRMRRMNKMWKKIGTPLLSHLAEIGKNYYDQNKDQLHATLEKKQAKLLIK